MPNIFRLRGVVQHYDWGGYAFLPKLLGQANHEQRPWAELWLGDHPKGPACIQLGDQWLPIDQMEGREDAPPREPLPYLFKVLDVRKMLSIQLHPTREQAAAGYAREEAAGIPRLAPNRNYKDRNHKPEMMVALTDFWLLHGFRDESAIAETLVRVPGWAALVAPLEEGGLSGLYRQVMEAPQAEVDALLRPLRDQLAEWNPTDPDEPDYWAWQAFQDYTRDGHFDRGLFSIYWFNLLRLAPGEGIFQGAGVPHAYLRGVNVELMANSDNVLRAGLTSKHIDVPELLACADIEPLAPNILKGEPKPPFGWQYPVPVPDFVLYRWEIPAGAGRERMVSGPTIYLVLAGQGQVAGQRVETGQSVLQLPGSSVSWLNVGESPLIIFEATVEE